MPTGDEVPKEPSIGELLMMSRLARLQRRMASGISYSQAAREMAEPESLESYTSRNVAAMKALQERLLSPEYIERSEAIQSETDPIKKAEASSQLKRDNFRLIDMEAVHRTIAARNRQMKAEGMLPADTST